MRKKATTCTTPRPVQNAGPLEDHFLQALEQHITKRPAKVLLAISGGIDSVAMGHLFYTFSKHFEIHCEVLHMNFSLRDEANTDAAFVKSLAKTWHFPCFVSKVETHSYAKAHKISVQMAARVLRYKWFEEMRIKQSAQYIATGHHLNDSLESLLLHLLRGTGLAALRGIAPTKDVLIRPLYEATKNEILETAQTKKWKWREDTSNTSTIYLRNHIRKNIAPVFLKSSKNPYPPLRRTFTRLREAQAVLDESHKHFEHQYIHHTSNYSCLSLPKLWRSAANRYHLFAALHHTGCSYKQFETICNTLDSQLVSGKKFLTSSHQIYLDRDRIYIVSRRRETFLPKVYINREDKEVFFRKNTKLVLQSLERCPKDLHNTSKEQAYLAYSKLVFPLEVREVRVGDIFFPLGMQNKKKLSDFMIDEKIPSFLKKNVWVMTSQQQIVWVIGWRIDDRFSIKQRHTKALKIILCTKDSTEE